MARTMSSLAGIFHHVDLEAALAQFDEDSARASLIDCVSGSTGVGIMSVANDQRETRALADRAGDPDRW